VASWENKVLKEGVHRRETEWNRKKNLKQFREGTVDAIKGRPFQGTKGAVDGEGTIWSGRIEWTETGNRTWLGRGWGVVLVCMLNN
jgi:hypothetical protein